MEKLDGKTMDVVQDNIEKLRQLFPEVFTEEKIDFEKLQLTLGEHIEIEKERYEFTWNGKTKAIQLAQKQSTGTLRPCKEESVDWDTTQNLYIEGDNFEVLRLLQNSYRNKVKMIYIDPPYNTGKDFIYKDDFKDNIQNYLVQTGQVDEEGRRISTNTESNGRFHTDWLNMMYPRLKLARNLLTDDGAIFISISEMEIANLRKICDEIFGEEGFVEIFSWQKTSTPPNLSSKTKKTFEYILLYQKGECKSFKGLTKFSKSTNGLMNQSNAIGILRFPHNKIQTSLNDAVYKAGIYGTKSYQIELLEDTEVLNNNFLKDVKLKGKFKWSQPYLDNQIEDGVAIYIKTDTFSPSYEKEEYEPEKPWNLIDKSFYVGTNINASSEVDLLMGANFSDNLYPKPTSLIQYLCNMVCDKESIILDFFSGSGTTADGIMRLNAEDDGHRKYIMIQLKEEIARKSDAYKEGYSYMTDIGKERIRRAGKKIKEEKKDKEGIENLDIGFKVFKLDETNLKIWNEEAENIVDHLLFFEGVVKEGRSQEDVLYEILLKYGLDLTLPIQEEKIGEITAFSVGVGYLVVCLSQNLSTEDIEQLVSNYTDCERMVFLDNCFESDEVKINAEQILKRNGIQDIRVI